MSTQPPPIAYAPPADPLGGALWTGLRIATVVWAAAILVRHASYWTTVGSFSPGTMTSLGVALAEAVVLVALAVAAIVASTPTPSRLRTLLVLACVMIALSAIGYAVDISKLPLGFTPEKLGRLVWMGASRVQVLAVPVALIAATAAMPRRML